MKYTPISVSPEQAQLLETRKFQINEIDRISVEAGGDLYLVNGNMLPLGLAGAYATTQTDEPAQPELEPELSQEPSSNELPLRRRT